VRARRAVATTLLVLLGGALGLAGAELMARMFAPRWQPSVSERSSLWEYDAELGWSHRPGAHSRFVGPSWDVDVAINSDGLRDVERVPSEAAGRRRLLLLGDSMAWGFGVEAHETLAAVLRERCPDWEFVNAAVSGYSTDQEYLYWRSHADRFGPHDVLVLVHANDITGNALGRMYGYAKPQFVWERGGLELRNTPVPRRRGWERAYTWLTAHSWFANGTLRRPPLGSWLEYGLLPGTGGPPDGREVTRRLLQRFASEARDAGAQLRVALVQMEPQTTAWLLDVAREARIPALDLAPALGAAQRSGTEVTLRGDKHWNAVGHRIAGDAIADALGCGRAASQ
jgi:hypothetical protein